MSHVDVGSSRSNWVINLIVILIKKRLIILLQYIAVWITYMIFFCIQHNAVNDKCWCQKLSCQGHSRRNDCMCDINRWSAVSQFNLNLNKKIPLNESTIIDFHKILAWEYWIPQESSRKFSPITQLDDSMISLTETGHQLMSLLPLINSPPCTSY